MPASPPTFCSSPSNRDADRTRQGGSFFFPEHNDHSSCSTSGILPVVGIPRSGNDVGLARSQGSGRSRGVERILSYLVKTGTGMESYRLVFMRREVKIKERRYKLSRFLRQNPRPFMIAHVSRAPATTRGTETCMA